MNIITTHAWKHSGYKARWPLHFTVYLNCYLRWRTLSTAWHVARFLLHKTIVFYLAGMQCLCWKTCKGFWYGIRGGLSTSYLSGLVRISKTFLSLPFFLPSFLFFFLSFFLSFVSSTWQPEVNDNASGNPINYLHNWEETILTLGCCLRPSGVHLPG